jgi:hypothetical protein
MDVGTASDPYLGKKLVISMHGDRYTPELPTYGNKVIAVMDGNLEMHGKPKISWTSLGVTAEAYTVDADGKPVLASGEYQMLPEADRKKIYVDHDVGNVDGATTDGWEIGDKIVIASSSFEASEYDEVEIGSFGVKVDDKGYEINLVTAI